VLRDVSIEGLGTYKLFGLTARFSRTPGAITAPPPRLGADTDAVLDELGVDAAERAALRARGVV
jgi:formyl-CoA transferase